MLALTRSHRARIAFVHDMVMAALSFPLALYLRVGELLPYFTIEFLLAGTATFTLIAAGAFRLFRLYRGVWRYASVNDLVAITKAVTLAILVFLPALFFLTRLEMVPRSLPFIQWFVLMALLGGPRFFYRVFKDRRLEHVLERSSQNRVPILLVGADDAAELFIRQQGRDPEAPYRVVGAIDDKSRRVGREIHGVPVLGGLADVEEIVRRVNPRPQRLVLTHDRIDGADVRNLLETAERLGLSLARLPRLSELKSGLADRIETRPVAVEDLLGRPQAVLDREAMRALIAGRRVLVTGAGGTIGGELVRQISDFGPSMLALLDANEYQLYLADLELAERHPTLPREAILANVRDRDRIETMMTQLAPDLVFHAAALKHVPVVEAHPLEGIQTNVIGSRNVADACRAAGVGLMVLISTDKAVNPTSVMGATKRLAESYCQALDLAQRPLGGTRFVTVRFGNVLGSTGSVVPLFQRQLAAGGPLTVTHSEVTRYFMTVREAVELVLQASADGARADGTSGKIYVLDMGEPMRILDLARQMIRLAGLRPEIDIAIEIVGLRPGEKLYEELLHDAESLEPAAAAGLLLAAPRTSDIALLQRALAELEDAARAGRTGAALDLVHRLIPEYQSPGPDAATAAR